MVIIVLSCLKLVMETYFDSEENYPKTVHAFNIIDYVFNALFILEMILKVIAKGFIIDKGSYLRDLGSRLDFFIVIVSILDMVLVKLNIPMLKVLRALRPLRFLNKYKTMRVVLNSLVHAFGPLMNVALVLIVVWIIFAVLGMFFLSEKMGRCDLGGEGGVAYGISLEACAEEGKRWTRSYYNFDNILEALVTLFLISTKEGWQYAMFDGMDVGNSHEGGPIYNNNPWIVIFYVSFLFISTFFLLDLVAGVIFFQYGEEMQEHISEATHSCTEEQARWIMVQKLIYSADSNFDLSVMPKNRFREICFKIVVHGLFTTFMLVVIVFNMIVLCMDYEYASDSWDLTLLRINYSLTWVFVAEFLLKFIAFDWKYFTSFWNNLDFLIMVASLVDFGFNIGTSDGSAPLRFIKVFRITRIFRIVKLFKSRYLSGFVKILNTLIFSLPTVLNVYVLFAMNLFIWSIVAAFTFKDIEGKTIEEFNNDVWSFKTFHLAYFTLFRCSTGEEWQKIMFLYGDIPGYYTYSRLVFLGFAIFNEFLVMNLLKLVIVEIFESFYFNPESPLNIVSEYGKLFNDTWNLFTAKYSGKKIHHLDLCRFFAHLP